MNCLYLGENRLFEYVDGQLSCRALTLVQSHVASCKACQSLAEKFRSLIAVVAGDLPVVPNDACDPWADLTAAHLEPDWFLLALADATAMRQTKRVADLLVHDLERITSLKAETPNAAVMLGYFTLGLELGFWHVGAEVEFSYGDLAASLLHQFDDVPSPDHWRDYAFLEMARGLVALHAEAYARAIRHLERTFAVISGLKPGERDLVVMAMVCDALARAYSRQGRYGRALHCARRGIAVAGRANHDELASAGRLRKAWTLLQLHGNGSREGVDLLKRVDVALHESGEDYLSRGNARAALAKVHAHNGQPSDALRLYAQALDDYREFSPKHPNLARALVNGAQVKLLLAAKLRQIGPDAPTLLFGTDADSHAPLKSHNVTRQIEGYEREAEVELREADEIYSRVRDIRGRGSVLIVTARLHLNKGECALALNKASDAYDLGKQRGDLFLMARGRIQQCRVAHAWQAADEPSASSTDVPLIRAKSFSAEAVDLTRRMQHRRLAAAALIWRGLILIHPYARDIPGALECRDRAEQNLDTRTRDYLWDELQWLTRLLAGHVREMRSAETASLKPMQRRPMTTTRGDRL